MTEPHTNHQTTTTVGQPTPMKPNYDTIINFQGFQHQATPPNPTEALLEASAEPPPQDSLEKFERTPLQHKMLKAYLGTSPQPNSGYPSTANLPTPNSRQTGNFGSVLIPMHIHANISPHQVMHLPTAAGPQHYYHASFSAQAFLPRQPDTSTQFMPAGRQNTFMSKLKKQVKQKKSTVNSASQNRRDIPPTPEDVQRGKQKMRKYLEKASQQPSGYNTMVSLNGGDCIGEQNLNKIERCIGIGSPMSPKGVLSNDQEKKQSPTQQPPPPEKKEAQLKNLQEEQREIEAKLKFIDSLINQQAPTSSFNVKYLGGGILKRQRTDDFVINLEQYQKAMLELKQTMDNLKVSTVEDDAGAADGEVEMYHRYQPVIAKSQYSDAPTENQTYQQQIEEALTRQQQPGQSRQRLFVPQSGQKTQLQGTMDEIDKSLMSNPSSNRLKEATLHRRSFDSHRNRESFRSYSFVLQNKMENLGQPDTNFAPGALSPDSKGQAPPQEITPEKGETGRERPQSCTLRVIKEVIINGRAEDEENAQGDDQGSNRGDGSKDGENNRYRSYQQNLPTLDMNKINMTFDQGAAENGQEYTKKNLYESKAFQTHTQFNHPNYKGEKVGNHKGGILLNQESGDLEINEDLSHIQNVLPISKGLEIRPSKTPTPIAGSTFSTKNSEKFSANKRRHYQHVGPQNDRPTTVPESLQPLDEQTEMGKKPLTSVGSVANHLLRSQTGLDMITENVMYQQDEDNTRGVIYFKNMDSLKSFIMSKKRPIFSKQGDRIISNGVSIGGSNSNWSSTANLKLKMKPKGPEELSKELKDDIDKKRQFLHRTLSTLMPQIQMKALLQQEHKMNYQQTIDVAQRKFLGASPPPTAPLNGHHWAPISSQNQTLYNPIPKTSYLFDDIMTADGIIDLRFMVNSPGNNNIYKPRLFSRQENGSSTLNQRSETSPGGIRKQGGQFFPKRLQNFYQFTNLDTYPLTVPQSKQGPKPTNQGDSRRKSRNTLGQLGSDTMSESNDGAGSSHNVTRQVVFFKTTGASGQQNVRAETGGSYNMQYPHLRPRLNMDHVSGTNTDTPNALKNSQGKGPSSVTVKHHQKYIKTGAVTTSSIVQIPTTQVSQTSLKLAEGGKSPEAVLEPSPNLLRMSKDIDKHKIRESLKNFGLMKSPQELADQSSNVGDSLKLRDSQGKIPPINPVKHVIFSTYEGQVRGLQFAKNVKNLAGNRIPPLYPQGGSSTQALNLKSSGLLTPSDKQDLPMSRNLTTTNFNTAFPGETAHGLTTAHSNTDQAQLGSMRSRAGTVSPKSRQAGQFFSNGGPGSLQIAAFTTGSSNLSPHKKLSTQFCLQENGGDRGPQTSQSGSGTRRCGGDVLGSVRNTLGTNQSSRGNRNNIKNLVHQGPGSIQSTASVLGAAEKKNKKQQNMHHRMGLSINQSKFTNAQSV